MIHYHELDEVTQLHLHSLELKECYKRAMKFLRNRNLATDHLLQYTGKDWKWDEAVIKYVTSPMSQTQLKKELTLYYLVAGAPINQIMKKLNVSQARIYELKNKPVQEHYRTSPIEGYFIDNPSASKNTANLLDVFNALDGYRIPRFDNSWQREKEKEEQERKRKLWREEGWERV